MTDVLQLGAFGTSRLEKWLTGPLLCALDQYGTGRRAKNPFGDAAEDDSFEARSSVSPHHDQLGADFAGQEHDFASGRSKAHMTYDAWAELADGLRIEFGQIDFRILTGPLELLWQVGSVDLVVLDRVGRIHDVNDMKLRFRIGPSKIGSRLERESRLLAIVDRSQDHSPPASSLCFIHGSLRS